MQAALLWRMHRAPLAYERHPQAATRPGPKVYQRRKPEVLSFPRRVRILLAMMNSMTKLRSWSLTTNGFEMRLPG